MRRVTTGPRAAPLGLTLLCAPALALEIGAPTITPSAKGTAPAPETEFVAIPGRATLTADMGAAIQAGSAGSKVTLALPFTVADTGEWVRVRRSFAAELLGSTVKGTFKVKRVRGSPIKVPGAKSSMRIPALTRGGGGGRPRAVGETADFVGRLAPGGYVLTVKLAYAKGKKAASWNNAGFPAAPHRVVLDAPGLRFTDSAAPAGGDGSAEHPFRTVAEAVANAASGDVVRLAPGTHCNGEAVPLQLGLTIAGAGAESTRFDGGFVVMAPAGDPPVTLVGLSFSGVLYHDIDSPSVPLVVKDCKLDDLEALPLPPGGELTVEQSTFAGNADVYWRDARVVFRSCRFDASLRFSGAPNAGSSLVADCDVAGDLGFSQSRASGDRVVSNCRFGGAVDIGATAAESGAAQYTISGCETARGIGARLSGCGIRVSGNSLAQGSIVVASTDSADFVDSEVVEDNVVREGTIRLLVSRAGLEVRGNTVHSTALVNEDGDATSGIEVVATEGVSVVGNSVDVPYAVPVSDDGASDEVRGIAVRISDAADVSGNSVRGGAFGIDVVASPVVLADNVISGSHVGLSGVVVGACRGNVVTDCKGDGMRLTINGPVEGNLVTRNGGAGVRFSGADLGGGTHGSVGGNTLRGNGAFDLVILSLAADAATILAEGNVWDHRTEALIQAQDIWDGDDDPALSKVDCVPFRRK